MNNWKCAFDHPIDQIKNETISLRLVLIFILLAAGAPAEAADNPTNLFDQASTGSGQARAEPTRPLRWLASGVEEFELETGYFTGPADRIDYLANLRLVYGFSWHFHTNWELRLAARLDGYREQGFRTVSELKVDTADSFLRYRSDRRRITLGAQTVIWGRADFDAPTDQMGVIDLSRGLIDELSRHRRSALAMRWEEYFEHTRLDVMWIPVFRPTRLPPQQSVWYPINRRSGRVFGMHDFPELANLLRVSSIDDGNVSGGSGGGGFRFSREAGSLDWALTVQRIRSPRPYFEIDPRLQPRLPDNLSLLDVIRARAQRATFQSVHPWTSVVGGDLGWAHNYSTWRLEAAWLSDVPVTTTQFALDSRSAILSAVAWEFFPSLGETRINVQLSARQLLDPGEIFERARTITMGGDLDSFWARQRWRLRLRYLVGLDHNQVYLNPELAMLRTHAGEFYIGAHWFSGQATSLGGLYRDNDWIVAGWRKRI